MRLDQGKEFKGNFWLSGFFAEQVTGTLNIVDGGKATLTLIGSFPRHNFDSDEVALSHHRILGCISDGSYVTLDNCIYTARALSIGGIDLPTFHCHYVSVGVGFDVPENSVTYSSAAFSFEGVELVAPVGEFDVQVDDDRQALRVSCLPPQPIDVDIREGVVLRLFNITSAKRDDLGSKISIVCSSRFSLSYQAPVVASQVREDISWIQRFLMLSAGQVLNLVDVSACSVRHQNVKLDWYYQSLPFHKGEFKKSIQGPLFTVRRLEGDFLNIIANWYRCRDQLQVPVYLYLESVCGEGHSINQRFLWLAQAVEPIARSIFPDTRKDPYISHVSRLAGLVFPRCSFNMDCDQFSTVVKDVRNYFTHYDERRANDVPEGRNFVALREDLRGVVVVSILSFVGFSDRQIEDAIRRGGMFRIRPYGDIQ